MFTDAPVTNNEAIHNFEMFIDGHRAFIDYQLKGDRIYLLHTEVPVDLEGKGVAASLVEKTFNYIEERGLKMVPYCSYIKVYLKKHPDWERLLA